MMEDDPKIFHITHVDNLPGILAYGGLWSDSQRIARSVANVNVGHLHIKERRLKRRVTTTAGGCLGDYVPFNFCPRSVMLYAVWRGHQDYAGGQDEIVHLVSSVGTARALGKPWAFTDRHAELGHAQHFDDPAKLPTEVPWGVMPLKFWPDAREERQAEFLVYDFFPWTSVLEVGVKTPSVAARVTTTLTTASHKPAITVKPEWYY